MCKQSILGCFFLLLRSLVPRPHPRGEEKGSGYNTTSHLTLEGHNQHTIVSDHVLTYAIYGILSMPRGPHCGAYYSNCAVIGHFTCQTAYITGLGGMLYCNQTLLLREGGVWARDYLLRGLGTRLAWDVLWCSKPAAKCTLHF